MQCGATEQLQASQQECAHLRAAAEDARAGSAKLEKDMEGLSGAYNALEAHCSALEARLRGAESDPGTTTAAGTHVVAILDVVSPANVLVDLPLLPLVACARHHIHVVVWLGYVRRRQRGGQWWRRGGRWLERSAHVLGAGASCHGCSNELRSCVGCCSQHLEHMITLCSGA